ncbi:MULTISPECIES: alpha/beta fold hydrolase [unclassified Streptomyces]|uniref:alpha/beta fold hydrolase n=1 Tax=unclassified Streptomyces TaxID=2593676 RepID=UPI002481AA6C|nr:MULTISPECIES: alpha/beta fold hydrolase [unclassified Streptomyces]MDA5280278.1 alpha/beta fold hydrolase [Streptomyces sp. Isolate_45]MDX2388545.1 alpha/beta hydrolase [Streptomyces sp. DK15]
MPKHSIHAATTAAVALVCLTAFGPAGGSAPPAPARPAGEPAPVAPVAPARFVPGPCPKPPEPIEALSNARCGVLEVPENRARPGGRTIELAVARIPATSAKPAADPVVFMAGGPGADTIDDIPFLVASGLNKDRELIVMAQRGNLYNRPNLACPEIDRFNSRAVGLGYDAPQAKALFLKAVKDCRDRLTADGTDLGAYNTTENAADFADLRKALKIPRWNVYGYSYGSNLALTYLRLHPEGIRAFAIDSVTPPRVVTLPWTWGSTAEGIDNILAACAAQPACKSRYPELRRLLTEQVRKLEAHPLTLDVTPSEGGKPVRTVLDGGALLNLIVASTPRPKDIPAALDELGRGNPERFAQARAAGSVQKVGEFAHGLTNSIVCGEWAPGYSESDVLEAGRKTFPGWPDTVLAQVPQLPFQYEACRIWNVPDRASGQRVPTVGSVPALVVSGTFDVKTGASWAKGVARDLSRSTSVQVPGIGHWVVPQSPCAQRVLASFFAHPTDPDTSCVDGLEPPPFTIVPR